MMTKDIRRKKRQLRTACCILMATFLTVTAAGCSGEPSANPTGEPIAKPTAVPTPNPGMLELTGEANPTEEPALSRVTFTGNTVEISEAGIGDTVRFGSYEQDNNTDNGAEAIEWLVLDKQDGNLLLLSKDALDSKKYNESNTSVTWETCTLREWLNSTFYDTAFSQAEQERIVMTTVKSEANPETGTEGGNDTEDKIFLLSIREAEGYFDPDPEACDPDRYAKITAYAKAQGGHVSSNSDYAENGTWWLRSPGSKGNHAAYVIDNGNVQRRGSGYFVYYDGVTVRPAFWLNPES